MIRHIRYTEIDKEKWDQCLKRSYNGILYGYSWYLDVVSPGWEALVKDDYSAVMPLTWGSKLGIRYLFTPFFVQQLGVFSATRITAEDVHDFLSSIPPEYKYWEINLNTFNNVAGNHFEYKPNLNHELDLIPEYDHLRKNYSDNTKRNIRKAEQNNLIAENDVSKEDIITLFRNDRGRRVKVLQEPQYDVLRTLLRVLDSRGRLHVRGVKSVQGDLLAGAFFVEANGKVIFLFSGNSPEGKDAGAMFFLVDRFIRENAMKNLILDFEGSNEGSLARFYRGFGAKECVYLQARYNNLPWPIKWYKG